ncbi:hypothetical protein QUF76_00615 [Desulfobacterales bacterium HSG16]|nr:hypothetical protein [Desulfobacterales bacterium HSG16]
MQYPLREKIGNPDLLVGREKEFTSFGKWIANIPKCLSKSRVILARRKSGKTALVQRIFNKLWSENGEVIPFYLDIAEKNIWYPDFAIDYYRTFASQVISFLERDEKLVRESLPLGEIKEYGISHSIKSFVRDVNLLIAEKKVGGLHDSMWQTAYSAPHRFADLYDRRFLVMLDEFQNIAGYVYRDEKCAGKPDKTLPGSFHSLSESKIAPMLVTGSYVSWLIEISGKYIQAGRLAEYYMKPCLTNEKGLQAVYKYAEVYNEPVTNETAFLINRLCMSDPFFISCVIQSNYENRDLSSEEGAIDTFNHEITNRRSHMSKTWSEYIQLTMHKVNDRYAKSMLLHLSRHSDRYWTHKELKDELQIDLDLDEIKKKLILLVEADVIEWGSSDIRFRGLQDGTFNLILRNRFEEEISGFIPDLKQEAHEQVRKLQKEKKSLQGMLNTLSGQFAEYQLATAFRTKKRFVLSEYFSDVKDTTRLNIINVKQRLPVQRKDGKNMELDVIAESDCGRIIVVEIKKWKTKIGKNIVEDFAEKIEIYAKNENISGKMILPVFLSLGGFTDEAIQFCKKMEIGTAERIMHF